MARKQKMKVYHGIPKSITDEHTIFYADFDGVIPQSPVTKTSTEMYGYSPTGYGIIFPSMQTQTSTGLDGFNINSNSNKFTIDFWATMKSIVSIPYQGRLFVMYFKKQDGSTTYVYMERDSATNKFHVWCADNGGYNLVFGSFDFTSANLNIPHHFRFVFKVGEYSKVYLDGKEVADVAYQNILPKETVSLTALNLGGKNFLISDVHISSIDRGDYFPNLPQDFIEGKAVIKPRMGQQQIKGDPMYSQTTTVKIPAFKDETSKLYCRYDNNAKGYLINNPEIFDVVNANLWNQGSTFKIRGLNDEIISANTTPTVKTVNGTTVQGVWSGLGTNEVTFTLGTNTGLQGQDLYVEYLLTMPYGNSDFPELPHTVERAWGENGVEMKPVTEIVITDDFRYKISGSTKECSHVLRQGANSSLVDPQSNSLSEISTERYGQISVKDSITRDYSVGTNRGAIPQHLISFNIIEIIERKLGAEIPSENKLTWVYNNVTVAVDVYARGTCPSGNYVQLNVYKAGVGWVDSIYNSTSQIHKMSWGNVISDGRVDSTGNIHFLLSTKACDGNITSTIYLDYALITLGLKTDSTFTTLYCDNKRAREDKCNPVLIQKETKTVKRYLPSKECFTTECLTSINKPINYSGKPILKSDFAYFTSQGTGSYNSNSDYYRECIAKLGLSNIKSYKFVNEAFSSLTNDGLTGDLRFIKDIVQSLGINADWTIPQKVVGKDYLALIPQLYNNNGELSLALVYREVINGSYTTNRDYVLYSLPNRPLIK